MAHNGPSSGSADSAPTYHPAGAAPATGNITELITGIISDSTTLLKQHLVMFQAEVKEDVQRTVSAGKFLGAGGFLLGVGLFFVLLGVPYLLQQLTEWPLWACFMTFGTVIVVAGVVALLVGRSLMAKFNPVPQKTLNALSENVSWLANRPN